MSLDLRGLRKTYGAEGPVLRDVSLSVAQGEFLALLGPSGSGKTTLIKIIAGFETPDTGQITYQGQSLLPLPPERRGVAMVFQNLLLFPHLSVAGNIAFGLKMRGRGAAEMAAKVDEMIQLLQLDGLADRRPSALSGGQQQRVALARALATEPKVLLLDEPMSGLDLHLREELGQNIRQLQRTTGITTVMVTHDQVEAARLADRMAILLDGNLAQTGPPEEVYRRPASEAVARFLGGTTFIPGTCQGTLFHSQLGQWQMAQPAKDGPATLALRPEALRLGPGENSFEAQIEDISFSGHETRLQVVAEGLVLPVRLRPSEAQGLQIGGRVTLHVSPQDLWCLPETLPPS